MSVKKEMLLVDDIVHVVVYRYGSSDDVLVLEHLDHEPSEESSLDDIRQDSSATFQSLKILSGRRIRLGDPLTTFVGCPVTS